jgi:hypothetical protein
MADIAEDQLSNRIRQISVLLPNRLGALLTLTRTLDAAEIKILALSILDASDHTVVRLVVDQPTLAREILTTEGHSVVETELLGVLLPSGVGIRQVLTAVIMAELNVLYLYSLMVTRQGTPVLALKTEDPGSAAAVLLDKGMRLLNQDDLQ